MDDSDPRQMARAVRKMTELAGEPITGEIEGVSPAVLPPQDRPPGLVSVMLEEPELGLQDTLTFGAGEYSPKLSLDYVSQPQVGAGVDLLGILDRFGRHIQGRAGKRPGLQQKKGHLRSEPPSTQGDRALLPGV